jgi:hypothetical protein
VKDEVWPLVRYTTAVNNFVECGFVAPCNKVLALTHIHILPENSHHWPRCKSADGVAAGNTAERFLREGLVLPASLEAVTISSVNQNRSPCSFSFKRGGAYAPRTEFSSERSWPVGMLVILQTASPLCKIFLPPMQHRGPRFLRQTSH